MLKTGGACVTDLTTARWKGRSSVPLYCRHVDLNCHTTGHHNRGGEVVPEADCSVRSLVRQNSSTTLTHTLDRAHVQAVSPPTFS